MDRILVFTPTYNEAQNVPKLYDALKKLPFKVDILFIDDNSPDGTGRIIDQLIRKDSSVHVIHRPKKMGTGTAFVEAFKFAKQKNYTLLIAMDTDLTHDPAYIPLMIEKLKTTHADIVIGSRYTEGGRMSGWNKIRLPFTHFWRGMIKYGLNMPFDATGAFRVYRVDILKNEIINQLKSYGFAIQMESIYRFKQHGAVIQEIPIHAKSRIHGESKLSRKIMKEVAFNYFRLLFDRLFGKKQKPLLRNL